MSSIFGVVLRAATFGESHGAAVGVVLEGVPAGLALTAADVQADLDRRRPGRGAYTSPRKEADQVELLSGLADGRTLGSPIAMLIRNTNQRSKDYGPLARLFRPGHADYTYFAKYGIPPQPGGGRASGRETAARVAAGAVARRLLAGQGVAVRSATVRVGEVAATTRDLDFAETDPLRSADPDAAAAMAAQVDAAREDGDSVGGVVEVVASGVPAGLGDPVFGKLDGRLAGALMGIGGVKGVEIGDGFAVAARRASDNNDQMDADGFLSNHAGGVLGGISSGQDIVCRLAIKPTPSISRTQSTRDLDGNQAAIEVHGRHDPCICPRVGPVAEAMVLLTLADCWLLQRAAAPLGG